jgi:N-acetylmuramoyl-L-alanine amidase
MKVVISSGHGKHIRGASDVLDEVDEARKVVEEIARHLQSFGIEVETFHDDTSTSQNQNLETIVDFHNARQRDLDVSVHFNAYQHTSKPMGTEVLYVTQQDLAGQVCDAIVAACGSENRGAKYRSDLYFLNQTEAPSILLEIVFVDSEADAELYHTHFDAICQAIAEVAADVPTEPTEKPPPEQPVSDNRVDISGTVEGAVTVILNGQVLRRALGDNLVSLEIVMHGDVAVTINGQDFHNAPTIPDNQRGIIASVFGGESDPNCSAYDESKMLNDTDFYVALPDRFEGDRPMVRVYNRASGESATAEIWDVGPWMIDDCYWDKGTRPIAETKEPLPSGPNQGEIPNGAGIDLSPALAAALQIDGMGEVDWEFVE